MTTAIVAVLQRRSLQCCSVGRYRVVAAVDTVSGDKQWMGTSYPSFFPR
ncbi:MAG: hypothetical protein LBS46_02560 [Dysgonamonadaceae bacterium]|nr:hypothetical protein [Dysgonamonadaceae bacterium]